MTTTMNTRTEGNFNYVPGSGIYCKDVVPQEDYAIAHAVFLDPPPVARAFDAIKAYLGSIGRPMAALCGSELRIPEALSFDGFGAFNDTWMALLDQYGLRAQGGAGAVHSRRLRGQAGDVPGRPHSSTGTSPSAHTGKRMASVGAAIALAGRIRGVGRCTG